MCYLDLYYIHPIDGLIEHYIPVSIVLAFVKAPLNFLVKLTLLMLIFNLYSHSDIDINSPHSKHHKNEKISYGIGIFLDYFFSKRTYINIIYNITLDWSLLYIFFRIYTYIDIYVLFIGILIINLILNYSSFLSLRLDNFNRKIRTNLIWKLFYNFLHIIGVSNDLEFMNWGCN